MGCSFHNVGATEITKGHEFHQWMRYVFLSIHRISKTFLPPASSNHKMRNSPFAPNPISFPQRSCFRISPFLFEHHLILQKDNLRVNAHFHILILFLLESLLGICDHLLMLFDGRVVKVEDLVTEYPEAVRADGWLRDFDGMNDGGGIPASLPIVPEIETTLLNNITLGDVSAIFVVAAYYPAHFEMFASLSSRKENFVEHSEQRLKLVDHSVDIYQLIKSQTMRIRQAEFSRSMRFAAINYDSQKMIVTIACCLKRTQQCTI